MVGPVLEDEVASLQSRDLEFGSQPHILYVEPIPLVEPLRNALAGDALVPELSQQPVTPVHLLLEALMLDPQLAAAMTPHGLTAEYVREKLRYVACHSPFRAVA